MDAVADQYSHQKRPRDAADGAARSSHRPSAPKLSEVCANDGVQQEAVAGTGHSGVASDGDDDDDDDGDDDDIPDVVVESADEDE